MEGATHFIAQINDRNFYGNKHYFTKPAKISYLSSYLRYDKNYSTIHTVAIFLIKYKNYRP